MKKVVFTISEELMETVEIAIRKFGFATRAEFYRHAALVFLQQTGLLSEKGEHSATVHQPEEELSDFEAHQKELAEFLMKYNKENGTDLPLPPGYTQSSSL